jgi:hypothetical protein
LVSASTTYSVLDDKKKPRSALSTRR